MPVKIMRHEDAGFRKAQQTGIYVGPSNGPKFGNDTRFFKAGADIPPGYRFSHERGAAPPEPKATK
jgi:hypothetical protein